MSTHWKDRFQKTLVKQEEIGAGLDYGIRKEKPRIIIQYSGADTMYLSAFQNPLDIQAIDTLKKLKGLDFVSNRLFL